MRKREKFGLFVLAVASVSAAGCADTWNCNQCGSTQICDEESQKCIDQSNENCGSIGNHCTNGNQCISGVCKCGDGADAVPCNHTCVVGECVDFQTNPNHCGKLGNKCNDGYVCTDGSCKGNCPGTQTMCSVGNNSVCADLSSDAKHCGNCDTACPEVDASKNIASGYCSNSTCHIRCEKDWQDADNDISNGCEKQIDTSGSKCGNNFVEAGEACDGVRLNDQTCATIVGEGSKGTLRCLPSCDGFDPSSCSTPNTCGNDKKDGMEICDGNQLGDATCASVVGNDSTGELLCAENCMEFDTSECSAPSSCGNNVLDQGEACDGSQINGATCAAIVGSGSTGTVTCKDNCSGFDVSNCTAAAVCGNGIIESGEECDGSKLNDQTCATQVGEGSTGTLKCDSKCNFVTEGCSAASVCGNAMLDSGEPCDGLLLNSKTCADIVGEGSTGTLRCAPNCVSFDVTGCTAASSCGNGIIESGETCDGSKLNDQTCATQVGEGSTGTLACNNKCNGFDTSGCTSSTTCGNGIIESGETCDGAKLNGATCETQVGTGSKGTVLCSSDCKSYNLSGCSAASKCGNDKVDTGEQCDGNVPASVTCASLVGQGSEGTVRCSDGCLYDTSECSASQYCGDGKIDANELCDTTSLGGLNCANVVGWGSDGTLKCNSNCTGYDTSECSPEIICGNTKLDANETCDGTLLNNATCSALRGYGSTGAVKCKSDCSGYDISGCSEPIKCGNGSIDAGELCDGYQVNGATCASEVGFGSTGQLVCNDTCTGFDKTVCSPANPCGNSQIDTGEQCDTSNLNGKSCADIVGIGSEGTLSCDSSCKFVTTSCSASHGCGNGTVEDNEECDLNAYKNGVKTCKDYDGNLYKSGSLKCNSNCTVDVSACTPYCGDGTVNVNKGEVCDGTSFNKKTCANIVGQGSEGTLLCRDDCRLIITTGCSEPKYCGDGKINVEGEECDGSVFSIGSNSCADYSDTYESGTLSCSACKVNATACIKKPYCGDNTVNQSSEQCDGSNFPDGKTTCVAWNSEEYKGGNVSCNADCTINYSTCQKIVPSVGDIITFGKYEQDNNATNGKEPIHWRVLDVNTTARRYLVISEKVLDVKQYYTYYNGIDWDHSTIRSWLNGYKETYNTAKIDFTNDNFIDAAFTAEEKEKIFLYNPNYGYWRSQIYLLGKTELQHYFTSNEDRRAEATIYAVKQGVKVVGSESGVSTENGTCADTHCYARWWSRDRNGGVTDVSGYIDVDGNLGKDAMVSDLHTGVRPVLWITY